MKNALRAALAAARPHLTSAINNQTSSHHHIIHQTFPMYAKLVNTEQELQQILHLQQQNLRGVNDAATEKEQGFVTLTHTMEQLQQLHRAEPAVIVKDNDMLAGYALVMPMACSNLVPELVSLFAGLNKLLYKGRPLAAYNFYIMGQVCVAPACRGKGVFDMLYEKHRQAYRHKYDFVITEIATRNTRSLRAHERVGFRTIEIYTDELDEWAVVIWDWSPPPNLPELGLG